MVGAESHKAERAERGEDGSAMDHAKRKILAAGTALTAMTGAKGAMVLADGGERNKSFCRAHLGRAMQNAV